jgi:hypothetical protein
MCTGMSCTIEALALALAFVHVQNQFLGRRDSQADGVHCRTFRRRMGNGKGDQAPDCTFGISSNKCAFYTYVYVVAYIFPLQKPRFPGHFSSAVSRGLGLRTTLFLYIACIHSNPAVYEAEK